MGRMTLIGSWLDHLDRGFTIRDDRATFAATAAKSWVAGPLKGASCIVRDSDKKFTPAYDQLFTDAGILVQKSRPRTPDMNAFAERFVRTVKEECTSRLVFLNQRQVEYALSEFLAHYHAERCHRAFRRTSRRIPIRSSIDGKAGWW